MATVRDSDISLWLHNKLGTSNDSWTSGSICSQLNSEVLRNIKDCFPDLQTQVKLKLLLSFFHIPRRYIDEWKVELEEIIEVAQVDSELWVSMLAEIMKTFSTTGSLNTSISENDQNKRMFSDLCADLKKLVRKQSESGILPLECHYLNKSALHSLVSQQPGPAKHFTLKRKPKSAVLRADLMQKSCDTVSATQKKSSAPTVPVRSRGMPRKMTDTTPLKGIPSRIPSGGFQSPAARGAIPRTPTPRKDGGIKLLDINEQPVAFAQKKRKKAQDEMANAAAVAAGATVVVGGSGMTPPSKKGPDAVALGSATPDYAAGLVAPASVPPPPQPLDLLSSPAPTYAPLPAQPTSVLVPGVVDMGATAVGAPAAVLTTLLPHASPATIISQITTPLQTEPMQIEDNRILKHQYITVQSAKPVEEKKLLLSRESVAEAQEIFKTANIVTRPEKALILGFMAGLRENPCPNLGHIISIKLNEEEKEENGVLTLIENHFQMNYQTGEWKVIVKKTRMPTLET